MRIWNLETCREVHTDSDPFYVSDFKGFHTPYYSDRPLSAVYCEIIDGRPVVLVAGCSGSIGMWDLKNRVENGQIQCENMSAEHYIRALKCGLLADDMHVAIAGGDDGFLYCWNLRNNSQIKEPIAAHKGRVTALEIAPIDSGDVVISAGQDGMLKIWSPSMEQLFEIDINTAVVDLKYLGANKIAILTAKGVIVIKLNRQFW